MDRVLFRRVGNNTQAMVRRWYCRMQSICTSRTAHRRADHCAMTIAAGFDLGMATAIILTRRRRPVTGTLSDNASKTAISVTTPGGPAPRLPAPGSMEGNPIYRELWEQRSPPICQ